MKRSYHPINDRYEACAHPVPSYNTLPPLSSRRAPEAFDPLIGGVSTAIDIFSLGVIMWECVTRTQPWEGLSNVAIIYQVGRNVINA